MPFKAAKTRGKEATQFICDRLEDSGLYVVKSRDHTQITLTQRPDLVEDPRTIRVLMANVFPQFKDYTTACGQNYTQGALTAPVLYKDKESETAFVRMVDRNGWRLEQSLKRYTAQQVNQMLALRKIEKAVQNNVGPHLTFYQPESDRLPEAICQFGLDTVSLDYSHIDAGDKRFDFVENRISIDYVLPTLEQSLTGPVRFKQINRGRFLQFSPAEPKPMQKDYPTDPTTGQSGFVF